MARQPFQVFGMDCWGTSDLVDVLSLISDEAEAEEFMEAYTAVCGEDTAVYNLRYLLAQTTIDRDEAERLADVFMVELPGKNVVLSPRHTFGSSSYGVDPEKQAPDYSHPMWNESQHNAPRVSGKIPVFNSGNPDLTNELHEMRRGTKPVKKAASKKPMKRRMISESDLDSGLLG